MEMASVLGVLSGAGADYEQPGSIIHVAPVGCIGATSESSSRDTEEAGGDLLVGAPLAQSCCQYRKEGRGWWIWRAELLFSDSRQLKDCCTGLTFIGGSRRGCC